MEAKDIQNDVMAVLFASGEPFETQRLAQMFSVSLAEMEEIIAQVNSRYEDFPFQIMKLGKTCQMVTRPQYEDVIRQALEVKHNAPLSQAALEVLAIIAYNQPVTRSFVEQVRGIDSSSVVNSLVAKGLVEEAGRLEIPGRPIAYATTPAFLRAFGMEEIEALPKIPDRDEENVQ